ncbi:MAG: ABC transporter permease subunit [Clostridioides difficile]|nr:ABC transporter permease subunit [Clostridioides sp.]MBS5788724.1 ABC transporter permease subunit [Clostridioides difficile]
MMKLISKITIRFIMFFLGISVLGVVFFIFGYVFWRGKEVVNISFIIDSPSGMPIGTSGGIYPALMGSIVLGIFSALVGGIFGILTAIYLVFYSQKGILTSFIKVSVYFLSGIPSIIFGLVGYTLLIYKLGIPRSIICAGLTVSAMILPFVAIRVQKIFRENETRYMQESLCLGIGKEHTILHMILPSCLVEIISTVALGMAYGMGAVAPIMYTGAVMISSIPVELNKPFMSLPYHLYMLVSDGTSFEYAYGTAFVLMILLLFIQLACRGIGSLRDGAQWRSRKNKVE